MPRAVKLPMTGASLACISAGGVGDPGAVSAVGDYRALPLAAPPRSLEWNGACDSFVEVSDMIPDADALWCMLQAFRLTLTELDKSIDAGSQLLAARHVAGTVLAASTVTRYEHQMATLTRYRDQMREIVAHWGTMIEDVPSIENRAGRTRTGTRAEATRSLRPASSTVCAPVNERRASLRQAKPGKRRGTDRHRTEGRWSQATLSEHTIISDRLCQPSHANP